MQQIHESSQLGLSSSFNNQEISNSSLKISSFKSFFAKQVSNILENKTLSALTLGTLLTAAVNLSKPTEIENTPQSDYSQAEIIQKSQKNNSRYETIKQSEIDHTLGYVDIEKGKVIIKEDLIRSQAKKYFLDENIFLNSVKSNEIF